MKRKVIIAGIAALCTTVAFSETNETARMNMRRLSRIERAGGWVTQPSNGKVIRIVNAQRRVSRASLEETAEQISHMTSFPVLVTDSTKTDPASLLVGDTAAAVIVKDSDGRERIVVAPEDGWATVNVRAIGADGADDARVTVRTAKEVWRAIGFVGGLGFSPEENDIMQPFYTIKEIDDSRYPFIQPMNMARMQKMWKRFGVKKERRIPYRVAVQEGWAAQPTNDYQKAIWDEVRALPEKPMKIEFDPKKGR